ncbi:MAG: phytoene/squalene synthase family protein [Myxococcota bacterium]
MATQSRQVLATHARTFNLAAVFLSANQRDDAAIVYAFCRQVDDLVDEADDPDAGRRAVEELSEMLHGRRSGSLLVDAFLEVASRCQFPLQAAQDLITGVVSDIGEVTCVDDADLVQYGYAVAGTVGLMMCGVIGVREPWALAHAVDLGIGMQITNICRDVVEDAQRGRIYIPSRRLVAAGIDPEKVRMGEIDGAAMAPVLREVLDLADRYYASGDQGMRAIPWRPRLAIQTASRVYGAIGGVLRDRDCDVTLGRAVVPMGTKIRRTTGAVMRAMCCGFLAKHPHDASLHLALQGRPGANPAAVASAPIPGKLAS